MAKYKFFCDVCGYIFEAEIKEDTVECPYCGEIMLVDEEWLWCGF